MDVKDVIEVKVLEVKRWGRTYVVVMTDFVKKLGLKEGDGFKVALTKNHIIIMQPVKNVEQYFKKKEGEISDTEI